ncbi:hypothetical protein LTR66_004641 [Elasticomyces elasticus]|nr:hypothetical protein LTR66_004641 [Elasticomyces elasticus]
MEAYIRRQEEMQNGLGSRSRAPRPERLTLLEPDTIPTHTNPRDRGTPSPRWLGPSIDNPVLPFLKHPADDELLTAAEESGSEDFNLEVGDEDDLCGPALTEFEQLLTQEPHKEQLRRLWERKEAALAQALQLCNDARKDARLEQEIFMSATARAQTGPGIEENAGAFVQQTSSVVNPRTPIPLHLAQQPEGGTIPPLSSADRAGQFLLQQAPGGRGPPPHLQHGDSGLSPPVTAVAALPSEIGQRQRGALKPPNFDPSSDSGVAEKDIGSFLYEDSDLRFLESHVKTLLLHSLAILPYDPEKAQSVAFSAMTSSRELDFPPFTARCAFYVAMAAFQCSQYREARDWFGEARVAKGVYIEGEAVDGWLGACTEEIDTDHNASDASSQLPSARGELSGVVGPGLDYVPQHPRVFGGLRNISDLGRHDSAVESEDEGSPYVYQYWSPERQFLSPVQVATLADAGSVVPDGDPAGLNGLHERLNDLYVMKLGPDGAYRRRWSSDERSDGSREAPIGALSEELSEALSKTSSDASSDASGDAWFEAPSEASSEAVSDAESGVGGDSKPARYRVVNEGRQSTEE